uniref:Uncharacterized protein n=1 Tax=Aegilops tauschii subsp. strangulata TaxID=200361 RepID=A0A453PCD6_AEGTS
RGSKYKMANSAALLHSLLSTAWTPRRRLDRASATRLAPSPGPPCRSRRPTRSVRSMASSTTAARADAAAPGLKEGIAGLYDESSGLWESIWGEHMHHGFYDSGEAASMSDHRRAQIRMIEEALAFAAVPGKQRPVRTLRSCRNSHQGRAICLVQPCRPNS